MHKIEHSNSRNANPKNTEKVEYNGVTAWGARDADGNKVDGVGVQWVGEKRQGVFLLDVSEAERLLRALPNAIASARALPDAIASAKRSAELSRKKAERSAVSPNRALRPNAEREAAQRAELASDTGFPMHVPLNQNLIHELAQCEWGRHEDNDRTSPDSEPPLVIDVCERSKGNYLIIESAKEASVEPTTNSTELASDSACAEERRRFEREECPRCGGSGEYSFNMVDGSRCYGCGGKKYRLTKRGAAANTYCVTLRSRRADALKVGDVVRTHNLTIGGRPFMNWSTVTAIGPDLSKRGTYGANGEVVWAPVPGAMLIVTSSRFGTVSHGGIPSDAMFEVHGTAEQRRATLEAALDYQDTLTKAGVPRKAAKRNSNGEV